jgi:ABC-type nitrate/sulfonate/bicarbonate transport system ATPase subunit
MTVAKLSVQGLAKTFGDARRGTEVTALAGVDIAVGAGEFVSVIGPSGCGKSTLLNLLAGLLEPSSGRIELDGEQPDTLLGRVGFMPQRDLLMPWRTVLDNVALGLEMRGESRRAARGRALAELPRFGLSGFDARWPATLSGGMRQRAALLRTFLAGHDVLLLDEPFGALDALTRQALQRWLLGIWQGDRKTILFVTHDVDEAIYLSDRVYVMSSRPGRMELCLPVNLPRPRSPDVLVTAGFLDHKRALMAPLAESARHHVGDVA